MISGVNVVLDGLDGPEPRYLINRTCTNLKIPYVFGAAIEGLGNVSTIVPGQTACLECFMPGLKNDDLPKCGVVGVHPAALGIVTAVQVFEAVRLLVGQEPQLLNKLLYIDLGDMEFRKMDLATRENCPVCNARNKDLPEPIADKLFEETCARDGRRNFIISPKKRVELNIDQLRNLLSERGLRIKSSGSFGITFEQSVDVTTSILKSGTMIVQTSPKVKNDQKHDVLETYKSLLIDGLGLPHGILPKA
jgi:adenylyltransferase/sulfurtransferase